MSRKWLLIGLMWLVSLSAWSVRRDSVARYADGTRIYGDSAIYQGMQLKLDVGTMAVEASVSNGQILAFEGALQVRLKNRFYPVVEYGYTKARATADGGVSVGQGSVIRVGMDLNGFRKHLESPHALLVGLRIGTALQGYAIENVLINDPYWQSARPISRVDEFRCDVWGEIVAGCNVQIWAGLFMGWYARFKILFTRGSQSNDVMPYYVPGYGYRDNTNWGLSYYIGYKF